MSGAALTWYAVPARPEQGDDAAFDTLRLEIEEHARPAQGEELQRLLERRACPSETGGVMRESQPASLFDHIDFDQIDAVTDRGLDGLEGVLRSERGRAAVADAQDAPLAQVHG